MRAATLILACVACSGHARIDVQADADLTFARLANYLLATEPAAFMTGARAAVAANQMRHTSAVMDAYTHDPDATEFDKDDPKQANTGIWKCESFADYMARRNAEAARAPPKPAPAPPPAPPMGPPKVYDDFAAEFAAAAEKDAGKPNDAFMKGLRGVKKFQR